jgi:hypothetical protein
MWIARRVAPAMSALGDFLRPAVLRDRPAAWHYAALFAPGSLLAGS